MTMGTASTMTSASRRWASPCPGRQSIPAADSRHAGDGRAQRAADRGDGLGGREALGLLTRAAFRNAIVTVLAIGGSTNAIIHLIAMARRIGVELSLADFEELGAGDAA
jgi:dihydroxy-acid dehydratase